MCRTSLLNIPLALTWIGCIPPAPLQRYLREAQADNMNTGLFTQKHLGININHPHKPQKLLSGDYEGNN